MDNERLDRWIGLPLESRREYLRPLVIGTPALNDMTVDVQDPVLRDTFVTIDRQLLRPICSRRARGCRFHNEQQRGHLLPRLWFADSGIRNHEQVRLCHSLGDQPWLVPMPLFSRLVAYRLLSASGLARQVPSLAPDLRRPKSDGAIPVRRQI